MFRSTGSYEPDLLRGKRRHIAKQFRSTGSYEPDHGSKIKHLGRWRFDPQALTSLTLAYGGDESVVGGFDPQALTSLTGFWLQPGARINPGFDPQALTSLTPPAGNTGTPGQVSIHRLLRA